MSDETIRNSNFTPKKSRDAQFLKRFLKAHGGVQQQMIGHLKPLTKA